MASWDVIVIGLGGVGSSAAYHLAKAGHRVLGIDQYPPAHDRGSSHGRTRIIRQAYFEHPAYVPLLQRSYQLWDELEQQAGEKLFYRTGLVELGPLNGIVIPGVLRSAAEHNLEIEQLSVAELSRCWPGISGQEDWQVVIERNAGFLGVEECVRSHLQTAHELGAGCLHGVKVERWEVDGSGVNVITSKSTRDFSAFTRRRNFPFFARVIAKGNIQTDQGVIFWVSSNNSDWRVRCQQTLG